MEDLTIQEQQFLIDRIIHGKQFAECWRNYKPDSKQNDDLARRSGYKTLRRIKAKCANWQTVYDQAGVGADRVAEMLDDCLKATRVIIRAGEPIEVPDHYTRLRAASLLADIHGLRDQTIKVNVHQPLPLIIQYPDGTQEIKHSKDDRNA